MQGKRSEYADWIMAYLEEQGEDTSNWKSYHTLYLRYAGRVKKFHPENYEQFLATCTFSKKTKKEPKEPGTEEPIVPFNEKKYWKEQEKEWKEYKARMKHYRDERITNLKQQGETGKWKDFPPCMFKFALRCLSGRIPEECFPERLNGYREELKSLLDDQKGS